MNGAEGQIMAENGNEPFDLTPLTKADGITEPLIMIGASCRFQPGGFPKCCDQHVGRIDAAAIGDVE